jgi:hypothetical protein
MLRMTESPTQIDDLAGLSVKPDGPFVVSSTESALVQELGPVTVT